MQRHIGPHIPEPAQGAMVESEPESPQAQGQYYYTDLNNDGSAPNTYIQDFSYGQQGGSHYRQSADQTGIAFMAEMGPGEPALDVYRHAPSGFEGEMMMGTAEEMGTVNYNTYRQPSGGHQAEEEEEEE